MATAQFPFYEETTILFHALNTFQYEKLDEMIDQNATTVMNSDNGSAMHSSREEWAAFLQEQYSLMKESTGKTDIKITEYLGAEVAKAEIEYSLAQQEMQPGNPVLDQLRQKLNALREQYRRAQSGGIGNDRYSIPLQNLPKLGREYVNLMRDVTILEQVNLYLETQRLQEAIQEARDVPTVQVLDEATPPMQRSAPSRFLMLLLTAVISPIIAVLFVLAIVVTKGFKQSTAEIL